MWSLYFILGPFCVAEEANDQLARQYKTYWWLHDTKLHSMSDNDTVRHWHTWTLTRTIWHWHNVTFKTLTQSMSPVNRIIHTSPGWQAMKGMRNLTDLQERVARSLPCWVYLPQDSLGGACLSPPGALCLSLWHAAGSKTCTQRKTSNV